MTEENSEDERFSPLEQEPDSVEFMYNGFLVPNYIGLWVQWNEGFEFPILDWSRGNSVNVRSCYQSFDKVIQRAEPSEMFWASMQQVFVMQGAQDERDLGVLKGSYDFEGFNWWEEHIVERIYYSEGGIFGLPPEVWWIARESINVDGLPWSHWGDEE